MAHTTRDKDKLLNRVRRIRGQLEAVQTALLEEKDCGEIMHLLAACRGALSSLTVEVIEGHVRAHIADPDAGGSRSRAAKDLVEVIRTYFR
jgi:DNA-binding FrmR family transcriptional regulator